MATSATLMVPCPWARDAAAMYRGEDVGVHLTLNAEWETYRWGPITHSPSLLDGDGGFPRTTADVWDHADVEEVRRECRTQIERAIYWGFDVSHLDSHMGALQLRPEFFDVYLELAVEFQLPLRMVSSSLEPMIGFPARRLAAEEGVVFTDNFVYSTLGSRSSIEKALFSLRPGVTEVFLHPAIDTRRTSSVASRLAASSRGPRLPDSRPVVHRPRRARRRHPDWLSGTPRAAAKRVTPEALAALCGAAMPEERLTAEELAHLCFGANDDLADEVVGDDRGAAVLQTQRFGSHVAAWLILLAVDPSAQGKGRGKELVHAVAERARSLGAGDLLLASAVPRYVWPGVDLMNTRVGMLLETCGFERDWLGTNMSIDTTFRRAPGPGVVVERERGTGAHDFAAREYPYWVPELDRAVGMGTAFAARDRRRRDDWLRLPLGQPLRLDRPDGNRPGAATRRRRFRGRRVRSAPISPSVDARPARSRG